MKIGFLITARLGSTRLAKKHLLIVNENPILYYLIKRIQFEFSEELEKNKAEIIIATSDEPENRKFADFSKYGVLVFYGSINNIPLRHYQTANAYGLDSIVSIDGDDILCSPKGMREVYRSLEQGVQYVKTTDLPFGMNSSGYTVSFLAASIKNHADDTLETGWGRIFDEKQLQEITIPFPVKNNSLRFTLDYEVDYQFFKKVIERCGDRIMQMSDEEITNVVLKEELFTINEVISKQYWENFYRLQKQEIENPSLI
ncbi:hypothetical protein KKC82_00985 [bacterium]|nr:hypothetical protein [bacterium]